MGKYLDMKNKKCIVIDVDGTIYDTKIGIIKALNYVLNMYGKSFISHDNEDLYIGPSIKESLMKYQGFDEIVATEATTLYRKIYVEKFVEEYTPYEEIEKVFQKLIRKGYVLGIATMKTFPQVERILCLSGFLSYFEEIKAARENGSLLKSQMLIDIKRKYNFISDFYMVGDTYGDYKASLEAGYKFIAADYGYGNIDNLRSFHVGKPKDILNIFC